MAGNGTGGPAGLLPGWVYLVEGGPGDPGLITVRGRQLLAEAELIVADPGLEAVLAAWAAPTAPIWLVGDAAPGDGAGKAPDGRAARGAPAAAGRLRAGEVAIRLARWLRAGLRVVRVYRGAVRREEARDLTAAGVPWLSVPGVPAVGDAGAAAPLLGAAPHPRDAAAREDAGPGEDPAPAAGRRGTAGDDDPPGAGSAAWPRPPLAGRRVLVTRTPDQAGDMAEFIRQLGGEPVEAPLIAVQPAADTAELDGYLQDPRPAWWVFTSANAVRAVARRLEALALDARALAGARLAVVGAATRDELWARLRLRPDLMPREFTGARVWEALAGRVAPGDRVIWPRGDRADPAAAAPVVQRGADLRAPVAYTTVLQPEVARALLPELAAGRLDALTFASPSAVEAFVTGLGREVLARLLSPAEPPRPAGSRPQVVCIGPRSAEQARRLGLPVDRVASPYTAAGLVLALVEDGRARGGEAASFSRDPKPPED